MLSKWLAVDPTATSIHHRDTEGVRRFDIVNLKFEIPTVRVLCASVVSRQLRLAKAKFALGTGAAVLALCAIFVLGQAQQVGHGETVLTNASIVKLVRAGFREKTVITIIRHRPTRFDLTPDRLVELKKSGVSEAIILQMLASAEGMEVADDEWSNDSFGDRLGSSTSSKRNGTTEPGETNIFGSSSGGRSRTRGRGNSGGNETDTSTTGSATVRILRPPTEAGGATGGELKLERTPTLTNESIINLVEANFSEGTIVRRIEESPADFDLSPVKLGELRRRRVSETVIAAMRQAMEGSPNSSRPNSNK